MSIHRVRLYHSTTDAQSYHGWLETWLTNMQPWEDDEVDNTLPTLREPIDSDQEYYQTELAFEWTEDKAHILDNLHLYAQSHCSWHRIGYHICSHDEDNPQPCSWENTEENGNVPDIIPTFNTNS